jgi:putative aldouronate transport system permease protein
MRQKEQSVPLRLSPRKRQLKKILVNTDLYLLILPALAVLFIFRYLPIYGIQIAFKDYNIRLGIDGSPGPV